MITRGVTIREGSLAIHGRWYMDGREEKQPTIIICHEFGTNMRFTSRGTPYLYLISVDLKVGLVEAESRRK